MDGLICNRPLTFPTQGKLKDKLYQHDYLVDLLTKASRKVGEDISTDSGLKHSSCSQYINEKHYSLDHVQMLTDHAEEKVLKNMLQFSLMKKED